MKIVQELKVEIESLEKTQTKVKLEIKKLRCPAKKNLINKVQDMKERLVHIEDKVEEMDT